MAEASRDDAGRTRRALAALNALLMAVAVTVIFVALYVVAAGQLLALLTERRDDAARWLGDRLGMEVRFESLSGEMRLLTPVVHLRGVRFHVADQPDVPVLSMGAMDLEVAALSSLLARKPVLDLLRIDGLALTLVEGEDGGFRVKGMPFRVNDPLAAERLRRALRVLYAQRDIVVENARVAVESGRLPVSAFERIALHAHGGDGRHEIAGGALVQGAGRLPVSFVMHFAGEPVVPAELVADVYLRVQPSSLEGWLPRRDAGPLWIDALAGGGEAWLRLERGQVGEVRGRVLVDNVAASNADGGKVDGLLGLGTRFWWRGTPSSWTLSLDKLGFRRKGETWPESEAALAFHRDADGNAQVRAMVSRGSLGMIAGFADLLPPAQADALAARLGARQLHGQVSDVRLAWEATADEAPRWRASLGFAQVALEGREGAAGFSGLSGRAELLPAGGVAELRLDSARLSLPTVFAAPLALSRGGMRLAWRHTGDGWLLRTGRFTLQNADVRASGLLALALSSGDAPARLRLLGLLEDGRVAATGRYLPLSVSVGTREWLDSALLDGRLRRGEFVFDGPLPLAAGSAANPRTFQMRYRGDGLRLAFLKDWPVLTGADADVWISGGRVEAGGRAGQLQESRLGDIRVVVEPREGMSSRLRVDTALDGDLADAFALFRGPLRAAVPAELQRWDGSGRLQARVSVDTLLGGEGPPRVRVEGTVGSGTLASVPHALNVDDVSGAVRYDSVEGFSAGGLRGIALGSALSGEARTVAGSGRAVTVVDLRGRMRMAPVKKWLAIPALDVLAGESDASLTLRFGNETELEVRSDLRGIASTAPSPLSKPAESAVETRFLRTLGTDSPRLQLHFGKALSADLQLERDVPVRGAISLGAARLPAAAGNGVVIEGATAALSLPAWIDFLARMGTAPAVAPGDSFAGAVSAVAAIADRVQRANIVATRLDTGALALDEATLGLTQSADGMSIMLDSRQLDGALVVPAGYRTGDGRALSVAIDRLQLPAAGPGNAGTAWQPARFPRMDIDARNLRIGDDDYGNWKAALQPRADGLVLADVQGNWRALAITGNGHWTRAADGSTASTFTGSAKVADIARVSEAFGFAPNLSSSSATVDVQLDWAGSPVDLDTGRAKGRFRVDVRDGRFITGSAKSQALRALGVFNVGTWQRRMKLDFTDLYKRGIAFDTLSGELALADGRLATQNLVAKGPAAMFEVRGETVLVSHALDARVDVTLPVNSNLYVGCLAGLAACAGIVAVERFWGDRLEKLTTLGYEVRGSWEDPQIRQLESGVAAPAVTR